MSGRLISLEGGEGAGKSTVMAAIDDWLRARGVDVLRTREPGGSPLGERIRELLLGSRDSMAAHTELLLMFAARAELVENTLRPALARGQWILTDRFTDASFAYQGGGRGIDGGFIAELERRVVGRRPDLTLLLDVDVAVGLGRARARGGEPDRIESESEAFFQRVRATYRAHAAAEPLRWRVVDASQPVERVVHDVQQALQEAWNRWTR